MHIGTSYIYRYTESYKARHLCHVVAHMWENGGEALNFSRNNFIYPLWTHTELYLYRVENCNAKKGKTYKRDIGNRRIIGIAVGIGLWYVIYLDCLAAVVTIIIVTVKSFDFIYCQIIEYINAVTFYINKEIKVYYMIVLIKYCFNWIFSYCKVLWQVFKIAFFWREIINSQKKIIFMTLCTIWFGQKG